MKKTILGLVAASLITTPALASWQSELFQRIDTDTNGVLSITELEATGCKVNRKFFWYADADNNAGLSKKEFLENRQLFRRCK